MSTIKNDQIWLYCHFNKLIKRAQNQFPRHKIEPKTYQKCFSYSTLVFDQYFLQYLGFKRNKQKCNFHYVAMHMMSQILKSVDFSKTQKSRNHENKALFFLQIKKLINCASRATVWQKNVLQQRQPLRIRNKLSVNARMLKIIVQDLEIIIFSIFVLLFLLFKIHVYFID